MTRKPPLNVGLNAEKVQAALTLVDGSPTRAARLLGVTRNTIVYWMDRGGMKRQVTIVQDDDIPNLVA